MEPVLGPVPPGARSALHIAVLVDTRGTGWCIEDESPYIHTGQGGVARAWCGVELQVPGLGRSLHCYSVHLPARSAVAELSEAQFLSALVTQQPQLALIGGDFNGFPRGGPAVTGEELDRMPGHLRVTRCRQGTGGQLEPNFDVDEVFVRGGLVDLAAHLPPTRRDPAELRPTGRGGARVDRVYGSPEIAAATTFYRQVKIGSDHDAVLVDVNLTALRDAVDQGRAAAVDEAAAVGRAGAEGGAG